MCIFCSIINKTIPSTKLYEDEYLYVFPDIHPRADTHIIVIPKIHIENLQDQNTKEKQQYIAHIINTIPIIIKSLNITHFKLVSNSGVESGQEVFHLHFHILSGNIQSLR